MGRGENTRGGFSVDGSYVWLLPCVVCVCVREVGGRRARKGGGPGFEGSKKESVKVGASEWLRV